MNSKDLAMLNRLKKIASGGGEIDTTYVDAQDAKTLSDAKSYTDTAVGGKAEKDHNHTGVYAPATHNHDSVYSKTNHNHDGTYAPKVHEHDQYLTEHQDISGKANVADLTSHTGNKSNPHGVTKSQVGLDNVENKSSATIRGELTKANVTDALGYTPPTENTTYSVATQSNDGLMSSADKTKLDGLEGGSGGSIVMTAKVTLPSSGWTLSGDVYVQTVSVSGVTANSILIVGPTPESFNVYGECGVRCVSQSLGTMTFNASANVTTTLTVSVLNLGE